MFDGPLLGRDRVVLPALLSPSGVLNAPPVSDGELPPSDVVSASTVEGTVIPAGLWSRSTQYCTWIPLNAVTSVFVFISAKVHDVEAHRSSWLIRLSRLFFLHQQPELSQPWSQVTQDKERKNGVGRHTLKGRSSSQSRMQGAINLYPG